MLAIAVSIETLDTYNIKVTTQIVCNLAGASIYAYNGIYMA